MKLDKKYFDSKCTSPITIDWTNPLTNTTEKREVPCGKCWHCRLTKVNEWTTRMYLNSFFRNHTFYITCTYDTDKLTPQVIEDTCAMEHDVNKFGKMQMTPLCLCKRHVQLFLKRLRKKFPTSRIQYYAVGEYGHNYGRPHYHLIIWSDDMITQEDFNSTWQLGNVDYHVLDQQITDTNTKSFGYVCKYLFKDFDYSKLPTLHLHKYNYETITQREPLTFIQWYNTHQKKYEHVPTPDSTFDIYLYFQKYGNFMLCSKGYAIGADYLQKHMDRFSKGDLRLFGIHDANFIFPYYFTRKAQQACCPNSALSNETKKPRSVVSTGTLKTYVMELCDSIMACQTKFQDFACAGFTADGYRKEDFLKELSSIMESNFYDFNTKEYYILTTWYKDNPDHPTDPLMGRDYICAYNRYKYSRKTKKYEYQGTTSVHDVLQKLDYTFNMLQKYFLKNNICKYYAGLQEKQDYIDAYCQGDPKIFEKELRERDIIYSQHRKNRQRKYLMTKVNF